MRLSNLSLQSSSWRLKGTLTRELKVTVQLQFRQFPLQNVWRVMPIMILVSFTLSSGNSFIISWTIDELFRLFDTSHQSLQRRWWVHSGKCRIQFVVAKSRQETSIIALWHSIYETNFTSCALIFFRIIRTYISVFQFSNRETWSWFWGKKWQH